MDRSKRNRLAVLALGTVVAVGGIGLAAAPNSDKREDRREERREDFGRGLNLTDAQKAQIKAIHAGSRQQIDAVRDNKNLTEDQREAQLRAIHQGALAQIKQILTPAQRRKLADRREDRHEKDAHPFAGLNLSDAQKAQIKPIEAAARQQIAAVKANTALTEDQREAELRAIHHSTISQINPILTPEQRHKLADRREDHREGAGGSK